MSYGAPVLAAPAPVLAAPIARYAVAAPAAAVTSYTSVTGVHAAPLLAPRVIAAPAPVLAAPAPLLAPRVLAAPAVAGKYFAESLGFRQTHRRASPPPQQNVSLVRRSPLRFMTP